MHIRQHLSRLVTAVTVGALLAMGAAVPSAQAATSDFTLSATATELGVDAATLATVVNSVSADDVRDGLSLDQGFKRQIQEFGGDTSDWINLDVTASVSAGTLSVTIPGSEVQTTEDYGAVVVPLLIGMIAQYTIRTACVASLTGSGVGSALVPVICTPLASGLGTFIGAMVKGAMDGTLNSVSYWIKALAATAFAVVGPFAWEKWISPWAKGPGAVLFQRLATKVKTWVATVKAFFGAVIGNAVQTIGDLLTDIGNQLPAGILDFDANQPAVGALPCDSYDADGAPCVATYSTARALFSYYGGPLYQVQRASDQAKTDIGLLTIGGYVNASEQDSFCANTSCTISKLYDQSAQWNDLTLAPDGGASSGNRLADANALPITVNGHEAYGVYIDGKMGYRNNNATATAGPGQPEGMYMVASGTHVNSGCCFDFGNAERNSQDTGNGHMDAVNLGTECYFQPCTGAGPWVEADLENGLFSGDNGSNPANKGNSSNFVTALLKNNGQTTYALKGGDSQGGGLSTWWNGGLPTRGGYKPMQQEGGIILGIGGDNSNWSVGSFFEGAMTQGYPSDAADTKAQASIVTATYAGNSGGPAATAAPSAAGPAVIHDGYSSVYTVNSANGHLEETYLPKMGDPWAAQDLSAKYGTPPVMVGTKPVSVTHDGYTSVYTVDAANGHLQETYLPKMGDPWATQDLTAKYGAPATGWTPTAVIHDGYTSVYSVDKVNGHLQETYLPKMGDPWTSQDLSAKYGTPPADAGSSPVALVHSGYTSVYTVDANHDLQETYLPAMGDPWTSQDLSAKYGTPRTGVTPTAVVHSGYTSVYTVDDGSQHLQETYLPAIGDDWHSQDLSGNYGTPAVAPGTQPVAFTHTGYTSVYTVDQGSLHLQETYLPAMGDPWTSQDLSAKYGTPPTDDTPIVLLHPDANGSVTWSSVFTVDESNQHLQETFLPGIGSAWTSKDLSAQYGTPAVAAAQFPASGWAVAHDGYASTYTVDLSNQHLQETYLTAMNQPWATQDLTANYGAPAVKAGTAPASATHDGYTSVYTIDSSNGHLQETYLTALGQPWHTQDLSAQFGTPVSATTPTALVHEGYTSVYTVASGTGHLWETYLSGLGASWISQDLTAKYGTPAVLAGTAPTSVLHSGWASVYTVDAANGHVQETYLPAVNDPWITQDLSAKYGTPASITGPGVLVHDGYTSVYTVDSNHDLQETYLPAIGTDWATQDMTAKYGTPTVASSTTLDMAPVALDHGGYASVYTIDQSNNHVQETFLPAISDAWTSQDLTAKYGTPAANQRPAVLEHADTTGALTWTSLYTVNSSNDDLEETYLPGIGANWVAQDLTAKYGTPPV